MSRDPEALSRRVRIPCSETAMTVQMANFTGLWVGSSDFWTDELRGA